MFYFERLWYYKDERADARLRGQMESAGAGFGYASQPVPSRLRWTYYYSGRNVSLLRLYFYLRE